MSNCPTQQELSDLSSGKLRADCVDAIADHLDSCEACQNQLPHVGPADALTQAVCGQPETDEFSEDAVYRRLATIAPWTRSEGSVVFPTAHALPPEQIAGCRIERRIGKGGMGVVYRALHTGLGRSVAIKLLNNERFSDSRTVDRFRREMTALGRVDHPNVVKAFDAGEEAGTAFLVMELIEGIDVGQLRRRAGSLAIADACEIIRQAAHGVQHAHDQNLIHRDIKPSNLMVHNDGLVKVLDLGLAMLSDLRAAPAKADISSRMVMGTIEYMAPEQMTSMHDVDTRADVYSLGVTFYELLTGTTPWSTSDSESLLQQIRSMALVDAPPVQLVRNDVPDDVAAVIDRMLVRDRSVRTISAAQVADAVSSYCSQSDLTALVQRTRLPTDAGEEITTFARRKRKLSAKIISIAATVAVSIGMGALLIPMFLAKPDRNIQTSFDSSPDAQTGSVEGPQPTVPAAIFAGLNSNVMDLKLFADDRRCATISWDGDLNVWKLDSGERNTMPARILNQNGLQDMELNCLAISRDESMIAVGGSIHRIYLWNAETGEFVREIFTANPAVISVDFDSTGARVFALMDHCVQVFEIDGSEVARHVVDSEHGHRPQMKLLPDGQSYLLLADKQVQLCAADDGRVLQMFSVENPALLTASATGEFAAAIHNRPAEVVVWNLKTGENLHRFPLQTDTQEFRTMKFIGDEQLAISGEDKTIRIWDISTGTEVSRIQGDSFCTQRLDVTSDGKRIISAGGWYVDEKLAVGEDFRLRVWNVPPRS